MNIFGVDPGLVSEISSLAKAIEGAGWVVFLGLIINGIIR